MAKAGRAASSGAAGTRKASAVVSAVFVDYQPDGRAGDTIRRGAPAAAR